MSQLSAFNQISRIVAGSLSSGLKFEASVIGILRNFPYQTFPHPASSRNGPNQFCLSILEAELSAMHISQSDSKSSLSLASHNHRQVQYRMPSNKNNIIITVPSLISVITPVIDPTLHRVSIECPLDKIHVPQECPSGQNTTEKEAARLIVIRRLKMNKHKRRKLRKKMKYVWAKIILRRKQRKERAFQEEMMAIVKTAETFSAEEYVKNLLAKSKEVPPPRRWHGKRLPVPVIQELYARKEENKRKKAEWDRHSKEVLQELERAGHK